MISWLWLIPAAMFGAIVAVMIVLLLMMVGRER